MVSLASSISSYFDNMFFFLEGLFCWSTEEVDALCNLQLIFAADGWKTFLKFEAVFFLMLCSFYWQ